jgi:hypothetical protein
MSNYLKSVIPLAVGVIVGIVFLAFGYDVEGRSILITTVGAAGIAWRVPNKK